MFGDRHGVGAVFRAIPIEILTAEKLGLPSKVLDLCYLTKGLVLVTGPTGSGKSTTLAALIDYINEHRTDHIITIEDPIEFVHENKKCLVNQREVHVHTRLASRTRSAPRCAKIPTSSSSARCATSRPSPSPSRPRRPATSSSARCTPRPRPRPSTASSISSPADRQAQIRVMLAEIAAAASSRRPCARRSAAAASRRYEILIGNSAVSNLIRNAKTFQLPSIMQTSRNLGMVTLNDSLIDHVKAGRVEPLEAYMKSVQKVEMKAALAKLGHELNVQEEKE